MARPVGFEPTTSRFEVCHSIQLSYGRKQWSGRRDSNSRHSPWQGDALPLSHSRLFSGTSAIIAHLVKNGKYELVRTKRFELPRHKALDPKSSASANSATPAYSRPSVRFHTYFPSGDPSAIRTPDTLIKSQVLCRLS